MDIPSLIRKYREELPQQIELLRRTTGDIRDPGEREAYEKDVVSYERRMREGFEYLSTLDDRVLALIGRIRDASPELLRENSERYRQALRAHREKNGITFPVDVREELQSRLRLVPLNHATKHAASLRKHGIHPASELWMSERKTTANPMDIVLGMDRYCFCTHGFSLANYGGESVLVDNALAEREGTIVSTVDIFKLVLMETGKSIPCAVPTKDWVGSLAEYERQLFAGPDFWSLKAEYVLTFFGSLDEYHAFAARHFYENFAEHAPEGELPFLGEVKVLGAIPAENIAA